MREGEVHLRMERMVQQAGREGESEMAEREAVTHRWTANPLPTLEKAPLREFRTLLLSTDTPGT